MKTLYLIRHSKAIPGESGVNDFKRPLEKRGIEDAKTISKRLQKKEIFPDIMISSPADRALETAHIFAEALNYPARQILLKEEIYEGGADNLRQIIAPLDDYYDVAMLFGHEPALSSLAAQLLRDAEGVELRTTGVIGIGFDIASWQSISDQTGTLLLFDFPVRATPKVYKKAKKAISDEISISIESILEGIDSGVSHYMQKVLKKTSKTLAKELTRVMQSSKIEHFADTHRRKRQNLPQEETAEQPAEVVTATTEAEHPASEEPRIEQDARQKKRRLKKTADENLSASNVKQRPTASENDEKNTKYA